MDGISTTVTGLSGDVNSIEQTLDGVVFYDSGSGSTVIDGSYITTGTILAERIDLTGAITFGDLASNLQTTINGKLDDEYIANQIRNGTVTGTFINGTTIYSPTIIAGEMYAMDENSYIKVDDESIKFYEYNGSVFMENWRIGRSSSTNAANFSSTIYPIVLGSAYGISLEGAVKLTRTYAYGSSTPDTGSEGQLFFVI